MTMIDQGSELAGFDDISVSIGLAERELDEELELLAMTCDALGRVLQDDGLVPEGARVTGYDVRGWNEEGVYGMWLSRKAITATVLTGDGAGATSAPIAVPVRFRHEESMDPKVLGHINGLADRSRPVRLPAMWIRSDDLH